MGVWIIIKLYVTSHRDSNKPITNNLKIYLMEILIMILCFFAFLGEALKSGGKIR